MGVKQLALAWRAKAAKGRANPRPTVSVDAAEKVLPESHCVEGGGNVHLLAGFELHLGHVFLSKDPLPTLSPGSGHLRSSPT